MDSNGFVDAWNVAREIAGRIWDDNRREINYALLAAFVALVKRVGKTVESGTVGVKFSFGRATRTCEPGFYPLVPFLQTIRVLPSRARTLELPEQRLSTLDGLVYSVDASLVYRITDMRKALIEIDDLGKGMQQMLGLAVQEVLRGLDRASLAVSVELDRALAEKLTRRLEPWGVHVERAALTTINPTAHTMRITQLGGRMGARGRALAIFESANVERSQGLALLGMTTRLARPTLRHRALALQQRHRRRWQLFESKLQVWLAAKPDEVPHNLRDFVLRDARQRFEDAHVA
jgi:regulator of protease activity HflC (stomatin/prohibitin superfamily)